MPPSLLPQMFAESALARVAYSALPNAPVRPHTGRRLLPRRIYSAVRRRSDATPASVTRIDGAAASGRPLPQEEHARVA